MTSLPPEIEAEARRPRPGFLIVAALFALGAIAAYLYEDAIIARSGDMAFVVLIAILVLVSLMFVLFYRMPSIGNRLLGHSAVLDAGQKERSSTMSTFTGAYKVETGMQEKRQATARKSARATRKQVAATTRAMQAEKKSKDQEDEA